MYCGGRSLGRRINNVLLHLTVGLSLPGCPSELLRSGGASLHVLQPCSASMNPTLSSGGSCRNALHNVQGASERTGRWGRTEVKMVFKKIIFLVTVTKGKHSGKQTARKKSYPAMIATQIKTRTWTLRLICNENKLVFGENKSDSYSKGFKLSERQMPELLLVSATTLRYNMEENNISTLKILFSAVHFSKPWCL